MILRRSSYLVLGLSCTALAAQVSASETLTGEALHKVCVPCHGEQAQGVEARRAPELSGLHSAYLVRQMKAFRAEMRGAHPQDLYGLQMILFARTLEDGDIGRLIDYISSLPHMPAAKTISGNSERGAQVYGSCTACHGDRGEGKEDLGAPQLAGMSDWYLVFQLQNFRCGARGYSEQDLFGRQMARAAQQHLPDEGAILDVVAYINELGRPAAGLAWPAAAQARAGERTESFFVGLPEDIVAVTYHGAGFLPVVPAGIVVKRNR